MRALKFLRDLVVDLKEPNGFEIIRLKRKKRYVVTTTHIFGFPFKIVDGASFAWQYIEIFRREIYKLRLQESNPYVLDCGANVGTSLLYFKKLNPDAEVVCFEPDPLVFQCLEQNASAAGLLNVQLLNKAVWNSESVLQFEKEGADGGRLTNEGQLRVQAVRLRNFLTRRVDLLKIDIEGAETTVLTDCADLLHHVQHLFVEYHSMASKGQDLHLLLGILNQAGFRYNLESVTLENRHPFLNRSVMNGYDNLINIYAWR